MTRVPARLVVQITARSLKNEEPIRHEAFRIGSRWVSGREWKVRWVELAHLILATFSRNNVFESVTQRLL